MADYADLPEDAVCSHLVGMFVHPNRRGQETGSALVSAFLNEVAAAGNTLCVVSPDERDLEHLTGYYQRFGFALTEPALTHGTLDPWLMAREAAA
ncbi:GNAT family N-acetyltransferase [Arthrobacter ginkgonis]|uniref:GNAT family N-acetyltransferase n=1 Tax=Arthrobacter ginkgonis TaxID=1630594 RepID=UPI0031ED693A